MLLCDTGVLLAAGNMNHHHHAACQALMRAAEGPLLVPSPVLGEIGYLHDLPYPIGVLEYVHRHDVPQLAQHLAEAIWADLQSGSQARNVSIIEQQPHRGLIILDGQSVCTFGQQKKHPGGLRVG
jgi:hypothetical protein